MIAAYYVALPLVFFAVAQRLMRRDPLQAVAFLLVLQVFLRMVLSKVVPSVAFASGTFINMTIVMLFFATVLRRPRLLLSRRSVILMGAVGLSLAYLAALALLRGYSPLAYVLYVRNFFFNIILLLLFLTVPGRREREGAFFVRFAVLLVATQILLGFAQFASYDVSDFFKIVEYERLGEVQAGLMDVFADEKVVTGTLRSMQNVSSFILMSVIFILSLRVTGRDRSLSTWQTPAWFASGVVVMLLAAVRAPLLGLGIGLGLVSWRKSRLTTVLLSLIFFIVIPLVLAALASQLDYATTVSAGVDVERPLARIVGALAVFDLDRLQYTTVGRTLLLSAQLSSGVVFGSGPGIIFTDYSVTDAFLMVLVLEFGLVGGLLLLAPYLYALHLLKRVDSGPLAAVGVILFVVTLSQSIVNEGLWADFANAHYMFLLMILFRLAADGRVELAAENAPTMWVQADGDGGRGDNVRSRPA